MGVDNLTNEQKYGIIQDEKVYMVCPHCHKKMFRVDKTSEYKKIYLSGFTYEDQDAFEELLQKLNAANVDVYIDASSVPQGMYQIGKLFDVETQNIELKKVDSDSLPK